MAVALLALLSLPASAMAAPSGGGTDDAWKWAQEGDFCRLTSDPSDASGHASRQIYRATSTWTWTVAGDVVEQTVTQKGSMTTDGVTRPFNAVQITRGPVDAYLNGASAPEAGYLFVPNFFDERLESDYSWTVGRFYDFQLLNHAEDGEDMTMGAVHCGPAAPGASTTPEPSDSPTPAY
jgi:hypothetical protein